MHRPRERAQRRPPGCRPRPLRPRKERRADLSAHSCLVRQPRAFGSRVLGRTHHLWSSQEGGPERPGLPKASKGTSTRAGESGYQLSSPGTADSVCPEQNHALGLDLYCFLHLPNINWIVYHTNNTGPTGKPGSPEIGREERGKSPPAVRKGLHSPCADCPPCHFATPALSVCTLLISLGSLS